MGDQKNQKPIPALMSLFQGDLKAKYNASQFIVKNVAPQPERPRPLEPLSASSLFLHDFYRGWVPDGKAAVLRNEANIAWTEICQGTDPTLRDFYMKAAAKMKAEYDSFKAMPVKKQNKPKNKEWKPDKEWKREKRVEKKAVKKAEKKRTAFYPTLTGFQLFFSDFKRDQNATALNDDEEEELRKKAFFKWNSIDTKTKREYFERSAVVNKNYVSQCRQRDNELAIDRIFGVEDENSETETPTQIKTDLNDEVDANNIVKMKTATDDKVNNVNNIVEMKAALDDEIILNVMEDLKTAVEKQEDENKIEELNTTLPSLKVEVILNIIEDLETTLIDENDVNKVNVNNVEETTHSVGSPATSSD